jgi:hypothetical protein
MKVSDLEKMLKEYRETFGDDDVDFAEWRDDGLHDVYLSELHDGYVSTDAGIIRECEFRLRAPA